MEKRKKEKSKLARWVIIGGLVAKGLILPIKADCPTIENINCYINLQQNLKKIESKNIYEKGKYLLAPDTTYHHKSF